MALKDQPITVCYRAWNTSTNTPQTGDRANHTLKLIQDGTEAPPTNSPTEPDSTNLPGIYQLALTAADMNFNCVVLGGKSSTVNVYLFGPTIVTERGVLPTVAPATSGGFLTVGTGAGQINPTGTGAVNANATANVTQWAGANVATPNVAGVPVVDVGYQGGQSLTGTAQGGSSNAITLADTESNIDGYYVGQYVAIVGGTGAGQARLIIGYVGETNVATVDTPWVTVPDDTSVYEIGGYAAVSFALSQLLGAPRDLGTVADSDMTMNDAMWAAIGAGAGQKDASSGTNEVISTPLTGTVLRTYTITTASTSPWGSNVPVKTT